MPRPRSRLPRRSARPSLRSASKLIGRTSLGGFIVVNPWRQTGMIATVHRPILDSYAYHQSFKLSGTLPRSESSSESDMSLDGESNVMSMRRKPGKNWNYTSLYLQVCRARKFVDSAYLTGSHPLQLAPSRCAALVLVVRREGSSCSVFVSTMNLRGRFKFSTRYSSEARDLSDNSPTLWRHLFNILCRLVWPKRPHVQPHHHQ